MVFNFLWFVVSLLETLNTNSPLLSNKIFCIYFICSGLGMQQVFSALFDVKDKKQDNVTTSA